MDHLLWARSQMAFSLGFHIIFAAIGMVMPFYMAIAHRRWLRDRNPVHLRLTHAWASGAAVLFATGAVSGTALSFQLGLLWPNFMEHAGPIIGMPFSLEGAAFFLEAIFLGLFLYGWNRLSPRVHWWTGVLVGVCGFASGILVVAANGWMNAPTGFTWTGTEATDVHPWRAMFNPAWPLQSLHMQVAALQAVGLAAAGLHAWGLLRRRNVDFHREALRIVLPLAMVASLVQPLVGDRSAKAVAERQPEKLAAMEAHFKTEKRAGLLVGGIPDEETQTVSYGFHIPGALSFLAHDDIDAEVTGLDEFPPEDRPPVLIPHLAFQVMVGIGTLLAALALLWGFARWRRPRWLESTLFLKTLVATTPLGFIALEAGWIVTEVGRQPWIIYRVLRTADAVTPVPGLHIVFWSIVALYTTLGFLSFGLLAKLFRRQMREPTP
jgi:cytochrome d ubiquinol oxidase subunit I